MPQFAPKAFEMSPDGLSSSSSSSRIGIIGAMKPEVASLKEAATIHRSTVIAAMEFVECTLKGHEVVVVQCGMGKVNAGICAHTLINIFHCTKIINTGVAGSLDAKMDVGDFVVSTEAVQHDYDVSPIGFRKGEIPYTGLVAFQADPSLVDAAISAIRYVKPKANIFRGRICSGDQFITSIERKDAIVDTFGGLCCEMEGGAIAQACQLNATPFVIVRCISDKPDGSAIVDFEEFSKSAAEICAKSVEHMVEGL
ncbi:MAG: 5'-methylthioadenosine/adenosylhomocysteine nucleosidase [Bacilli bacterium]|nr:5'-methylthioadenosine/adenosylhomocysteine nucleosidase [Bacilli bacterium]